MEPSRTIVIIGAGFCGTLLAIRLLRQPWQGSRHIVLLDPAMAGRGIAYARRDYPYLLNVPASRMSADPDEPHSFLRFLHQTDAKVKAEDFALRERYGDYLEELLRTAEAQAPAGRLLRLAGTASRVEPTGRGHGYRIELTDGRSLIADTLVIATGNPRPAPLPCFERIQEHTAYIADLWTAPSTFRSHENVLVVGTGLTMADVVLAGTARAANLTVHALSRHGLLALPQTDFGHAPLESQGRQALMAAGHSARRTFRVVRELAREVQRRGGDWREVLTPVRSLAPALWQRLAPRERKRFLRHARCWWDVHRHRLPMQSHTELSRLQARGQLVIHAGRLLDLEPFRDRIKVSWRARGAAQPSSMLVDRVVNCTGPDIDVRRSADPLMRSLLAQGLVSADPLGLGIKTSPQNQLIGSNGQPSAQLYYVGPMLRASHWEATAVQELREHAVDLANHLAAGRTPHVCSG